MWNAECGMSRKFTLSLLPEVFAICQLAQDAAVPDWALAGNFLSVTRTAEELSVVCPQTHVPAGVKSSPGWRGLKVEGPFDFSEIGIIASLAGPLADAGVSIFVISTFDTDYLLVKEESLEKATSGLSAHGHTALDGVRANP
jgi:hypothetical protein